MIRAAAALTLLAVLGAGAWRGASGPVVRRAIESIPANVVYDGD